MFSHLKVCIYKDRDSDISFLNQFIFNAVQGCEANNIHFITNEKSYENKH